MPANTTTTRSASPSPTQGSPTWTTSSLRLPIYHALPPTSNTLPGLQRARLMRSTRKLGALLGTTPFLADDGEDVDVPTAYYLTAAGFDAQEWTGEWDHAWEEKVKRETAPAPMKTHARRLLAQDKRKRREGSLFDGQAFVPPASPITSDDSSATSSPSSDGSRPSSPESIASTTSTHSTSAHAPLLARRARAKTVTARPTKREVPPNPLVLRLTPVLVTPADVRAIPTPDSDALFTASWEQARFTARPRPRAGSRSSKPAGPRTPKTPTSAAAMRSVWSPITPDMPSIPGIPSTPTTPTTPTTPSPVPDSPATPDSPASPLTPATPDSPPTPTTHTAAAHTAAHARRAKMAKLTRHLGAGVPAALVFAQPQPSSQLPAAIALSGAATRRPSLVINTTTTTLTTVQNDATLPRVLRPQRLGPAAPAFSNPFAPAPESSANQHQYHYAKRARRRSASVDFGLLSTKESFIAPRSPVSAPGLESGCGSDSVGYGGHGYGSGYARGSVRVRGLGLVRGDVSGLGGEYGYGHGHGGLGGAGEGGADWAEVQRRLRRLR